MQGNAAPAVSSKPRQEPVEPAGAGKATGAAGEEGAGGAGGLKGGQGSRLARVGPARAKGAAVAKGGTRDSGGRRPGEPGQQGPRDIMKQALGANIDTHSKRAPPEKQAGSRPGD